MQFNYSNANNYLAGAKEVNDISTDIYNTSRVTGVNVNKLIETERKARDTKFDAKLAAEKTIGQSALNLTAINKKKDIERKSKKAVEKIMKPARQMAGVLAMTNAGLGAKKLGQDAAIAAKESAELKKIREANLATDAKERAEKKALRDKLTDFIKSGGKTSTATSVLYIISCASRSTATLPVFSLKSNSKTFGKNTKDALNSGFLWGYQGLINNIIKKITLSGKKNYKIILTGGYAKLFKKFILYYML